ncbi:MAG: hypothetical protein KC729_00600 [Candidatus Eisenbacteria bacterium]|uniref:Damage-inducible protein DinB n=1 Tax=Eiseniibacteriota bacterium TaxID=2212470 RepID=A0A956LUW0_UNCEI|nr:hypothetical protein [Candidatus Eisenbacteria bacterium]
MPIRPADIVTYHDWAATQLLDALERAPQAPARAVSLLSHVIAAEHVWHERVEGRIAQIAFWPDFDLPRLRELAVHNLEDWQRTLSRDDLDRVIAYRNSKGIAYETPIQEILLHLLSHGAYHRGQITEAMREAGLPLLNTDFIVYLRQRD